MPLSSFRLPVAAELPEKVDPMTVAVACGALPSPPPNPEAEFPEMTLLRAVSTPVPLAIPPPAHLPALRGPRQRNSGSGSAPW